MKRRKRKDNFSPWLYRRHQYHLFIVITKCSIALALSGAFAIATVVPVFKGQGEAFAASIASAILIYILVSTGFTAPEWFKMRLLPYFEEPLGDTDTWLAGEELLWSSRRLDMIAEANGWMPLSSFCSGDDMVPGEKLRWFPPEPALYTTESLLSLSGREAFAPGLISDLTKVRDALRVAADKKKQFCFILREGSTTIGLEMDQRKGSFF